jgi:hypothetical protein
MVILSHKNPTLMKGNKLKIKQNKFIYDKNRIDLNKVGRRLNDLHSVKIHHKALFLNSYLASI